MDNIININGKEYNLNEITKPVHIAQQLLNEPAKSGRPKITIYYRYNDELVKVKQAFNNTVYPFDKAVYSVLYVNIIGHSGLSQNLLIGCIAYDAEALVIKDMIFAESFKLNGQKFNIWINEDFQFSVVIHKPTQIKQIIEEPIKSQYKKDKRYLD